VQRALLLNATFEPLCVVPLRRAVILVLSQKAVVVEHGAGEYHSERLNVTLPSVIRLTRYVKVPYRTTVPLSRKAVIARDGGHCAYCEGHATTVDHVLPRSRGGEHVWENVVAACGRCNNRKAHHTLSELNWHLRAQPYAPKGTAWVIIAIGRVEPSWQPFLVTERGHVAAVPA
jgi:5-methylcytosine-specific restriction endonuclease McrA